jgi:hypothetical protein
VPQRATVPRVVSSLKTESHAKGCNFTKDVKLVGGSNVARNGDFADESNFAKCSDAAKEVCNSTNKNNSGLNKRQRYKGSDTTAMTATRHWNKVCRQHQFSQADPGTAMQTSLDARLPAM